MVGNISIARNAKQSVPDDHRDNALDAGECPALMRLGWAIPSAALLGQVCSLEAHWPDLRHVRQALRTRVASSFSAPQQSPRPPQRHAPRTQTVSLRTEGGLHLTFKSFWTTLSAYTAGQGGSIYHPRLS